METFDEYLARYPLVGKEWVDDLNAVLSACNLSGVVLSWAEWMHEICEWGRDKGTEWKNRHPINTLILNQLCQLNRCYMGDSREVHWAFDWLRKCEEAING